MNIRDFQKNDINKGLLELYKENWFITKIDENTIEKFLNNDNYLIIAEENNIIVGALTLHLQFKIIRDGGIVGFIEDVIVKEKFRGNKIGEKLVKTAIEKARLKGCYKITLNCFDERVNFYERCGFFRESNTMRYNV